MSIVLGTEAYNRLKNWLEEHYPHEACGFFSGVQHETGRSIKDLWPVENKSSENRRRRFVIDPFDYLKAERKVEELNTSLLGVFHSHPDHPAYPSEHDLAGAQPWFSYIIASVHDGILGDIRSFRLKGDQFIEEEVIIDFNDNP